ncbi:MAG: DUF3108 domain-containing protein [Geminicoccaceae bacterium]|nr:DUF3108 domain-containing protein [Geminicoccaceae bacterium]
MAGPTLMGMRESLARSVPLVHGRGRLATVALAALLALAAARASGDPPAIDARYAIEVAGIRVAELALTVTPAEGGIASRLVMQSVGLAAAWSGARSELATVMRRPAEGAPSPIRFEAVHSKRDREREIRIRYDGDGSVAELALKSQGRPRAPEVPEELQIGTVDPLTAFERLRDWLPRAASGEAERALTLPIFDGRKRYDLEANYVGPSAALDGRSGLHELSVRLVGRWGFDPDDRFIELPDGDRPAPLRVLVDAANGAIPLRIDVPDRRAGPVVTLLRDCRAERCPPPS